jgi:hypothetical protein
MMSTITGGVPILKNFPGSVKSLALKPSNGAPNFVSAEYTALLFSASALIRTWRSLVARVGVQVHRRCQSLQSSVTGEPLLFKGDGFTDTDVTASAY